MAFYIKCVGDISTDTSNLVSVGDYFNGDGFQDSSQKKSYSSESDAITVLTDLGINSLLSGSGGLSIVEE